MKILLSVDEPVTGLVLMLVPDDSGAHRAQKRATVLGVTMVQIQCELDVDDLEDTLLATASAYRPPVTA